MSNAWETTEDDVLNVVHNMGKKISGDKCHEILNALDHFKIECEALQATDPDPCDSQTDAAYQEIRRQIEEENLL